MKTFSFFFTALFIAGVWAYAATNQPGAATPGLSPQAEAAARAALEKAYGPAAPTTPSSAQAANPNAAQVLAAAAAGQAAGATNAPAITPGASPVPARPFAATPAPGGPTNRAATNPIAPFPGFARATNATVGATNRSGLQATPVNPATAGAAPAPARNVAGTPAAGAAGAGAAGAGAPGAGAPGAAGAAAAPGAPGGVLPAGLIKFQEADLNQVLEVYQDLTGRTVLKPASLPQAKISIRTQTELTLAEGVQALDTVLGMNGISMVPIGQKFIKAVPEAQAGNTGVPFNERPTEDLPEMGGYITQVIQLTNAAPNDVLPVLTPFSKAPNGILTIPSTSMIVLRDYVENVKRMVEMIRKIDVMPQQDFESVVIPIRFALAGDIATVLGNLTQGGGQTTTVGGQGQRGGLTGGLGGLSGGGLGGGAGGGLPGQPGYNPNNPNAFNQQQGLQGNLRGGQGGTGGRSGFQNRLQQIVNRAASGASGDIFVLGNTKIIADERINALLIFATKPDLITISNIIDKLDVVLQQVLIEAIVMEVSLGNDLNYGVSYLQTKPTTFGDVATGIGAIKNVPFLNALNFGSLATNAAGALPGGFSYYASFANFDATATAIANDSRVNVISRPRIQTSHAVEADLFVGQTRPYVTGTYSYFGGGPQTQFQQQQIGLTLSVLPLINNEGLVVMDIHTKIQQIGEDVPIDATFSVPETIDREARAKVAVRDRESIMLGGFIATTKNKSRSGVPILKDIPILGALFRTTKDSDQRREMIILIRPTVLPNPQDAATYAAEAQSRMPATRRADLEFIESERKLLEQENLREEKANRKLYKKEGFSK